MTPVTYFFRPFTRVPGYNSIYNARRGPPPVATNNDLGHYWCRTRCEFMSFASRNQFSLIELYRRISVAKNAKQQFLEKTN